MEYFEELEKGLRECHRIASEARAKGLDPERNIEIKITTDVASRVEGIVGPKGIENIIREMEANGMSRQDIAFKITEKISKGEIIQGNKEQLIDQAVRTGLAILTEGVLVAPTEGIAKIKIRENPDGTNYIAVYYAGPIRSAGGTIVALSVILADVARKTAGIGDYRPLDTEIERYVEEVNIYEARVAHLQYKPSDDDVRVIVRNCPVCIDGDPTEEVEVSVHKNLARVETNRIRGGIPLVVCEGIALKAQKVLKYTKKLDLNWTWLEQIIKIKVKEDRVEIKPDDGYLEGLVAGRPVFAYPSKKGGFRLRYGKTRTNGIMAKSIHPAVMLILDNFLAYGTHMKIERPGKGCIVTSCEEIEPPVVRLKNGRVMKVRTIQQAKEIKEQIEKILFLGDIVSTHGDFLKSNHPLIPVGYCQEWWRKEVEAKGLSSPEFTDVKKAFEYCKEKEVPLHPDYLLFWDSISIEQLKELVEWIKKGTITSNEEKIERLELLNGKEKEILEELLVEHLIEEGKVVLESNEAYSLLLTLGAIENNQINTQKIEKILEENGEAGVLSVLTKASSVEIRAKGRAYIGARMGRPEKAKERAMDGNPNVLFPTGSPNNRSILKRYKDAKEVAGGKRINLELVRYRCKNCSNITIYASCELCGGECEIQKICRKCNKVVSTDVHCEADTVHYDRRPVDLISLIDRMKKKLGFLPEDLKGVKGLSNRERVPERLEKGAIRAKHGVYVFRDGTSRFDASDVPLTHFKPNEIGLDLEKAKELGYEKDYLGKELINGEQIVPLRVQDILIARNGAEYFMRVANAIDDMLVMIYGMPAYYNVKKPEEMIGKLCLGLSPHTSAAVLCRIIGFTDANVGYAHPFFHNAKRRNCFDGETKIPVLKDEKWEMKRIRDIVDNNLTERIEQDSFGTQHNTICGMKTLSFNQDTKKFEIREIVAVSKHMNPRKMIELETSSGRKIVVTPDHPFPSKKGKLNAENIDELMIPNEINIDEGKNADKIIKKLLAGCEGTRINKHGQCFFDSVKRKREIIRKDPYSYSLTVSPHHTIIANGIVAHQCDGDEDGIMLLMDALLNFSRHYLNEKRGGTMDAPIVLSVKLNPKEIDDEAFCIEIVDSYPLEFYKACENYAAPHSVKLRKVEDILGKEEQYEHLPFTLHSRSIDEGNTKSAYVELGSIPEKIAMEFALEERLKNVEIRDIAKRLILSHFIPDIYGNLRSYSRQTFRCVNCHSIYRRVPLVGKCIKCNGNLTLTIHKGGIEKYLKISRELTEKYDLPVYLKQRLELVEKEIRNIFENDKVKQTGLWDFV